MSSLAVAAVVGTVLSAVGTVASGIAQSNAASYRAAVDRNNAVTAQQNATYAREAGAVQEQIAGRKAAAQLGAVRSGIAANNVDVNTGSALDVQKGEREAGALSEETVAHNALLQAYGYETQATGFQAEAGLQEGQAGAAVPGSLLAAGGKLATDYSLLPNKFASMTDDSGAGKMGG